MIRRLFLAFTLACALSAVPIQAASRVIVRIQGGVSVLKTACGLIGCNVGQSIGDPAGQLFVVTSQLNLATLIKQLLLVPAVIDCEADVLAKSADASYSVPPALTDTNPVSYFGTTVPDGYVNQPATGIVRLFDAQNSFQVSGSGMVAVIDTGVDPNHPALAGVLLPGYDFTRNSYGADETADVSFPSSPSPGPPNWVSSRAVANVSQSTAAVVDGPPGYSDFGHGTMVAGIIHLVAPTSQILPLKAFGSDGTGYLSNILRAIYTAVQWNAQVINMSFSFPDYSPEVKNAMQYASSQGVISVAAAGNDGQQTMVYPAGYTNLVIGVASTTNGDQRSSFSNYGQPLVWVAAPGEGVVTTYPFGFYAASWGTSFSTPLVAGTAALLIQLGWGCGEYNAADAVAHAVALSPDLGNGRLDIYQAVRAWAIASGMGGQSQWYHKPGRADGRSLRPAARGR